MLLQSSMFGQLLVYRIWNRSSLSNDNNNFQLSSNPKHDMGDFPFQAICKLCYYAKLKEKNESAIVESDKTIFNKITHDK